MLPVVHIFIISPLRWTVLTKRLMPVMLDDNDPNKTEKPVDPSFCVCIERNPNDWVLCDGHK